MNKKYIAILVAVFIASILIVKLVFTKDLQSDATKKAAQSTTAQVNMPVAQTEQKSQNQNEIKPEKSANGVEPSSGASSQLSTIEKQQVAAQVLSAAAVDMANVEKQIQLATETGDEVKAKSLKEKLKQMQAVVDKLETQYPALVQ